MSDNMIKRLQAYLEKDPYDTFTRFALALEYVKGNEPVKAKTLFEQIVSDDPEYVGTYYHLGKLYEQINATDRARETYHKGIQAAQTAGDPKSLAELKEALQVLEWSQE
jgi:Tfp pilus assembly protein PilF